MTDEELIKNQFPNDEFLQSGVLQIVDKCTAELEKENAELRKQLVEKGQHLELTEREWGKDTTKLIHFKTQLTKAKELLAKWVELYRPKLEGYPITPIQEQTEQFLSEVKK